jgi:hypothetical protein
VQLQKKYQHGNTISSIVSWKKKGIFWPILKNTWSNLRFNKKKLQHIKSESHVEITQCHTYMNAHSICIGNIWWISIGSIFRPYSQLAIIEPNKDVYVHIVIAICKLKYCHIFLADDLLSLQKTILWKFLFAERVLMKYVLVQTKIFCLAHWSQYSTPIVEVLELIIWCKYN